MKRFEVVSRAIRRRRALRFLYRKPGERHANIRHVRPYHLTSNGSRWYLIGHDLDRDEIRTFALARMKEGAMLGGAFHKPKEFSVERYLNGNLIFR